ncbi:MAG: pitrilysin family protein [Rhodoferax sp.]|nr:pitrilysin family protein [Rhodoferax sp.]
MIALKNIATGALLTGAMTLFCLNPALAGIPIEYWTQPSGAQVYLAQSPGIPMVDVQIDFDAGGRRDPPDKAGLASVTADMTSAGVLARGPDAALDENALSDAWADLGAGFDGGASSERMSFSLRSLTYPDLLGRAVQLAARQLGEPAFPEAVWERNRQRLDASLKEALTRPGTVAGRAFAAAVYGSHPYGYQVTPATLAHISVTDMQALYASLIVPCRAKVSLVGAVTRAQADALVTTLLSRLPATTSCAPLSTIPEVQPLAKAEDIRIPFDAAQAQVLIGQPGFKRDDPDYFALTVGNYILGGGGFVSRLSSEVRQKRALSYTVYSYFAPGLHAGAFTIGLQTRPDQADEAVQVARGVVARFVAEGPTEAELKAAKDNLIGGFALRIDSNRKLLGNIANIAWNNLPLDYLDSWTQQVQKVTVADIKAAFARKLQLDRMVTVVVGGVK